MPTLVNSIIDWLQKFQFYNLFCAECTRLLICSSLFQCGHNFMWETTWTPKIAHFKSGQNQLPKGISIWRVFCKQRIMGRGSSQMIKYTNLILTILHRKLTVSSKLRAHIPEMQKNSIFCKFDESHELVLRNIAKLASGIYPLQKRKRKNILKWSFLCSHDYSMDHSNVNLFRSKSSEKMWTKNVIKLWIIRLV